MSGEGELQKQREILALLNQAYPAPVFRPALKETLPSTDDHQLAALVQHLHELGYVEARIHISNSLPQRATLLNAVITARGRDYLKEDGGLTAVRDTLTIRLHADTIRDLIVAQIERSELEGSAKQKLIEQVKSLPAKGLEGVVGKLAEEGLARLPNAIQWLQTAISGALS
jgi:hypothetical protein